MSNDKLVAAALLALLPTFAVHAECLPAASRTTFRNALLAQLRRSTVTPDELYRHAHDRLGFGTAPHRAGARPPETGDPLVALADVIVDQLASADVVDRGADNLLARITRTSTPTDVIDLDAHPYRHAATGMAEAYSEIQVYAREASALRKRIDALPASDPRRPALEARFQAFRRSATIARNEARDAATARAFGTAFMSANADVGATLTEFWANHFNVDAEKVVWPAVDYRTMLQRGACGRFDTLLIKVAKHPAMAMYLDNFRSRVGAINENYARELMELHTFGDDLYRYYQQSDVVGVARVLSGWSIAFDHPSADVYVPGFRFYAGAHDGARITLFAGAPRGVALTLEAASGDAAVRRGERLLGYLADHVGTRRNICGKLSRRLIGDAPTPLIDACAADAVWGTGGDLGSIYRFFLTRPEMWQASPADDGLVSGHRYYAKEKNPFELLVSAYRAVRMPNTTLTQPFVRDNFTVLRQLGLLPAQTPPPTGYKDGNVWLSSGLLLTWNQQLFTGVITDALSYRPANRTLRGAELEAYFVQRVAADPSASAQRALGTTIARDVVQYPDLAVLADTFYPALVESDAARSGGARAPLRSYVHGLLGHANFLRK